MTEDEAKSVLGVFGASMVRCEISTVNNPADTLPGEPDNMMVLKLYFRPADSRTGWTQGDDVNAALKLLSGRKAEELWPLHRDQPPPT